jgi:hypothetical protein
MAEKKTKQTNTKKFKLHKPQLSKQQQVVFGIFLALLGLALTIAFISHLFHWQADQSTLTEFADRQEQAENLLNKFGATISDFFIYQGFGVAAFILSTLITLTGIYLFFSFPLKPLKTFWFWGILIMLWISVFFGFFASAGFNLGGVVGFEINSYLQDYLGLIGTAFLLGFLFVTYLVVRLEVTPEKVIVFFKSKRQEIKEEFAFAKGSKEEEKIEEEDIPKPFIKVNIPKKEETTATTPLEIKREPIIIKSENEDDISLEVEQVEDEEEVDVLSNRLVKDFGEFDPRLELGNYKFPTLDLLKEYNTGGGITIDQEELEANKNTIVETLRNYKIEIDVDTAVVTDNETLADLFSAGGMSGMLGTIWLIICAMVFGGIMDAIGALKVITRSLLRLFHTTFGLFASTVASCLALNVTASDQYLAIVVPGKMFAKAYEDKGLAPENLSRTLEDSGTVTSVLIPWNTCGAYHSGVLGVSTMDYFVYAIFNWLSPFTTLFFAAFSIKIKMLRDTNKE